MTNTWQETLEWYRTHQTAREIGFNPDGMCLKVCRTARKIGPKYLSAKNAQDATPAKDRVKQVSMLRKGMVLYFDDPKDSNKAGHIVTMIGRVKDGDVNDLDNVLVETNSVKKGELVVVRASYFKKYWGDSFQFGADSLNGVQIDHAGDNQGTPPKVKTKSDLEDFWASRPEWDVKDLDKVKTNDSRRALLAIHNALAILPEDPQDSNVNRFRERFEKDRVLDMRLLDKAVANGRVGSVKKARDQINAALKRLPIR